MKRIAWFKELTKDSIPIAGGKGANLGEMFSAGLPVPSGFCVTAQTYKEFIDRTKISDKILKIVDTIKDYEDNDVLQKNANEVQKLILDTKVPEDIAKEIIEAYNVMNADSESESSQTPETPFVAVRSSATAEDLPEASFAGQQATFLNIRGDENLIKAVRACWASLFTARAVYYRKKNNFDSSTVLISVVIQKMINSDAAGIMFSANPATNNLNEIVIEAGWGLGETIVSGSVNPDLYIVDKTSMTIKKKQVKKQTWGLFRNKETGENEERDISSELMDFQVLKDFQILKLAKLAKQIEKHYGKPEDMEFAVEGEEVYIVQARPITTLKEKSSESKGDIDVADAKILAKGETASAGIASGPVKIIKDISELNKIQKGDILVTSMTTPDMVPAMERASAIVTDEGGMTCHAAIVSREMETPCIVGTGNITSLVKDLDIITVDATQGVVYEGAIKHKAPVDNGVASQCIVDPVTATKIKVICDVPSVAERAAQTNADGVGLVRLEIIIAESGIHPAQYIREDRDDEYTKMIANGLRKIAKPFQGKPVWVRTSDIRTDEYRGLKGGDSEPKESDPMIGWHAIRRGLDEPRILIAEFKAIKLLHDEGLTNLGVMIPFVIRPDEVVHAKEIMEKVGLVPSKDIEFGIMCETPAAVWVMEDICKAGIDFVSFGTNDLTQLTLGIDRNNEHIAKLFDELHPAVLREIQEVVSVCQKYNVETSICGQAGSKEEMAEFLVRIGVDSISVNSDAVHKIRQLVARIEKKLLLEDARKH